MAEQADVKRTGWRKARAGVLSLAFILTTAVIGMLSLEVTRKLDALATANSDNVQWTLSQVEVEFLHFQNAVLVVQSQDPPDLSEVRKRFDIFYSRVDTLRNSRVYADLRVEPEFNEQLAATRDFLDTLVPVIDGSDTNLDTALPEIAAATADHSADVRAMSLHGISAFAEQSDAGRRGVSEILLRVGILTVGLLAALLLLLAALFTLYRQVQARSEKVQSTTARLRAIVSTSLDAILVVNREGRVLDYNGAAEAIFGYTREEAIGERMSDLVVPDHYHAAHEAGMARYRKTGVPHVVGKGRMQLEAKRKSGEVFPVEMSINSAQGESGEIFVSFLRDISARKAAELALMKARDEALAGEKAKAELLAVMSHEMRTPLNGLLGTMELLELTKLDARQREYLDIMNTSGAVLLHHVNDVLDISRLDSDMASVTLSRFDAGLLVSEVVDGLRGVARAASNTITVRTIGASPGFVTGDPRRLRQVLLNLVGNAAKFTRNGEITIETEALKSGDMVEFRVSDTGIGIAEADLGRVFDDFVTLDASFGRETGGTGLGLAITRRLVTAMGGEIGVESELGEGSLFWVRLPLPAATNPTEHALAPAEARDVTDRPGAGMSVLIVEDNRINRRIARDMLTNLGCTVDEANDGDEGVAMATRRKFDLILMDISMPRMDGVEATKAIRKGDGPSSDTRIVALTAHALPDDIQRFRAAGMQDALIKPLRIRALADMLRQKAPAPAPTAHAKSPPLDSEQWQELIELLGPDRARVALTEFLEEGQAAIDGLVSGLTDGTTIEVLGQRAHKLAGSAAVFGATELNTILQDAEASAILGERDTLSDAISRAAAAWAAARDGMQHASDANPTPQD